MRELVGIISTFSLISFIGCGKEIPIVNQSDQYSVCNSILISCSDSPVGPYCLFGYKWGADQDFNDIGVNATGPQTSGGTITFSFQEKSGSINTHRQVGVPAESWAEILDCAKGKIRIAIQDWEEVADITFEELPENSESDIQFYVAAIMQSAVGFPNYSEDPCNTLSGDVIFDANSKEKSCEAFYISALHEIGHVLGLGHVSAQNVMEPGSSKFSLQGLQEGDILGVQQIYGEKK